MTSNERDALVKRINGRLAKAGRKLKSIRGVGRLIDTQTGNIVELNIDIEAYGRALGVLKISSAGAPAIPPADLPALRSPIFSEQTPAAAQAIRDMVVALHNDNPSSEPEQDYSNSVVSKHSRHTPIPADEPAPEPVTAPVLAAELTTEELLARAAAIVAASAPAVKLRKPRGEAIVIGKVYGEWTVKAPLGHSRFSCTSSNGDTATLYAAVLRAAVK